MRLQKVSRGPELRRANHQLPRDHRLPAVYRILAEAEHDGGSDDPLARDPQVAMVEAALIMADEPMPLRKLVQVAGLSDVSTARRLVRKLQSLYDLDGTAFQVEELAGGFQMLSRAEYHRWLASLRRGHQELRLTGAGRETLAIIAYRQPITRADVEAIRGVHCGDTIKALMEKGFVKIAGRDESLGRPVLYGTTKKFLQVFGLKNLKDLPKAETLVPHPPPESPNSDPE